MAAKPICFPIVFPHDCTPTFPLISNSVLVVPVDFGRVAVDMKYHIHIHIHRCLSCVNMYPVNNYKKHSCFLLSTGSIYN